MGDIDAWDVSAAPGTLRGDGRHICAIGAFGDPRRDKAESISRELGALSAEWAKRHGNSTRVKNPTPFPDEERSKFATAMLACSERIHDALREPPYPREDNGASAGVPEICWDLLWALRLRQKREGGRAFDPNIGRDPTIAEIRALIQEEREILAQTQAARSEDRAAHPAH